MQPCHEEAAVQLILHQAARTDSFKLVPKTNGEARGLQEDASNLRGKKKSDARITKKREGLLAREFGDEDDILVATMSRGSADSR